MHRYRLTQERMLVRLCLRTGASELHAFCAKGSQSSIATTGACSGQVAAARLGLPYGKGSLLCRLASTSGCILSGNEALGGGSGRDRAAAGGSGLGGGPGSSVSLSGNLGAPSMRRGATALHSSPDSQPRPLMCRELSSRDHPCWGASLSAHTAFGYCPVRPGRRSWRSTPP